MLRGLIRLGKNKITEEETTNLGEAKKNFILAAKYAESVNDLDRGRSLGLAGWVSYLLGEMPEALSSLQSSVKIFPKDSRSYYDLAKVYFHVGQKEQGLLSFKKALKINSYYALRAGADLDFLKYRDDVEAVIENRRQALIDEGIKPLLLKYDQISLLCKQSIIEEYNKNNSNYPPIKYLEFLKNNISKITLLDIPEHASKASKNFESIYEKLKEQQKSLEHSIVNTQFTIRSLNGALKAVNQGRYKKNSWLPFNQPSSSKQTKLSDQITKQNKLLSTMTSNLVVVKETLASIQKFASKSFIISTDKINNVIGSDGSIIQSIMKETSTKIDISEDGNVKVSGVDDKSIEEAVIKIKDIAMNPEIGQIYRAIVTKIMPWGAFVKFFGTREGLVHISELSNEFRTLIIEDVIKQGQEIFVKLIRFDDDGKARLSMKMVDQETGYEILQE